MTQLAKLGAPAGCAKVQGEIQFQSHFFEPNGNFHARINYPTRGADINVAVSHPVGRWQIDEINFTAESACDRLRVDLQLVTTSPPGGKQLSAPLPRGNG